MLPLNRDNPNRETPAPENSLFKPLRGVRDIALLLLVGALGTGAFYSERERKKQDQLVTSLGSSVRKLEASIQLQSATKSVTTNARGWPMTVEPKWFNYSPPINRMVTPDRPWLEIAGPDQAGLMHPPVRVTIDENLASFWYNPYQGIVRARVPMTLSEEDALEMYNRVNSAGLSSLFWCEKPMVLPNLDNATAVAGAEKQEEGAKEGSEVVNVDTGP